MSMDRVVGVVIPLVQSWIDRGSVAFGDRDAVADEVCVTASALGLAPKRTAPREEAEAYNEVLTVAIDAVMAALKPKPTMNPPRTKLLTLSGNPKTAKGRAKGYAVAVLHLAPASLSGRNVCPAATQGCIAACLNLAGRGGIAKGGLLTHEDVATGARTNHVQRARLRRTEMLYNDRAGFLVTLLHEVGRFVDWCAHEGFTPVLRLNGTSDLDWDGMAPPVMAKIRDMGVIRYDYTKVVKRLAKRADRLHQTLSLTEHNDAEAADWLAMGGNVAAVFRGPELPATYTLAGRTFPVVNGDEDDLRFLDPKGCIVGLKAKGPAKRDASGFVRS